LLFFWKKRHFPFYLHRFLPALRQTPKRSQRLVNAGRSIQTRPKARVATLCLIPQWRGRHTACDRKQAYSKRQSGFLGSFVPSFLFPPGSSQSSRGSVNAEPLDDMYSRCPQSMGAHQAQSSHVNSESLRPVKYNIKTSLIFRAWLKSCRRHQVRGSIRLHKYPSKFRGTRQHRFRSYPAVIKILRPSLSLLESSSV
jgi:hypothetical protein